MAHEIIAAINALEGTSPDVHWFCPNDENTPDADVIDLDTVNPDKLPPEKQKRLKDVAERRKMIFLAMKMFAYEDDNEDARRCRDKLKRMLVLQLQRCEACILGHHRNRDLLKHELGQAYDEDDVSEFMAKYDEITIERINKGLDHANNQLIRLPENERSIAKIDPAGTWAIYEALACDALLRDERILAEHFDNPFRNSQKKKPKPTLSVSLYLPAMTAFLFYPLDGTDRLRFRRLWAERCWRDWVGKKKNLTQADFEFAVQKPFMRAMSRVQMTAMDKDFLPIFWSGTSVLISHLDENIITHSLKGLDIDLCMLCLEHMHMEFPGFPDLMTTFKTLIETAPQAFWDSMNVINPQTIIEQVFQSKSMTKILTPDDTLFVLESEPISLLPKVFDWIDPFLSTIKGANRATACRSLVKQLMDIYDDDFANYPMTTRNFCFDRALDALTQTVETLVTNKNSHSRRLAVDPACAADFIKVVNDQVPLILEHTKKMNNDSDKSGRGGKLLKVIESVLELDCLLLMSCRESILDGKTADRDQLAASTGIWTQLIESIREDDVALATHVLVGASKQSYLDHIYPKMVASEREHDINAFNTALERVCDGVGRVLEQSTLFNTRDLASMFKITASAIVAALSNPHKPTRLQAVDMLKAVSSEAGRKEALAFIIKSAYQPVMSALQDNLKRISATKLFNPVASVTRVCADVVDVLSDQDGILRSKNLSDEESDATEEFWVQLWSNLNKIFEGTEYWSNKGYPKPALVSFCQEAMQLAQRLFDAHSIFVGAIVLDKTVEEGGTKIMTRQLLTHVNRAMGSLAVWLRLRDEYLINTITKVVSELLYRLHEAEIEIEDRTKEFIEGVLARKIRVNLNASQLAGLQKAYDTHFDITEADDASRKSSINSAGRKRSKIDLDSWAKAAASQPGRHESSSKDLTAYITKGAEAYRNRLKAKHKESISRPGPRNLIDAKALAEERAKTKAEKEKRIAEAQSARLNKIGGLGGTGLQGIGVLGKDHSVKANSMMVSSDEESEDDLYAELFGPEEKDPRLSRPGGPEVTMILHQKGPTKVKRIVRSQKDMRARLAPDLSSLHRTILSWDFFHQGDYPPKVTQNIYNEVPDKFTHALEYKQVMQPLLLMEAWQGFVKAREENDLKAYEIKIVNRVSVDSYFELNTTMSYDDNRDISLGEGDIILLSSDSKPLPDDPHCLAKVHKVIRKSKMLEIMYRTLNQPGMSKYLVPNTTLYGTKVMSIIPLEREYASLESLHFYDLCDYILRGQPSHLLEYSAKQLDPISSTYSLNTAQAKAVKSAIDNDAFTLIQGPPGSGKTKTIVATVGALLSDVLKDSGGAFQIHRPSMSGQHAPASSGSLPKKILVCAPSNAAVDELVMRFKEGVRTLSGKLNKINVVRLGRPDAINSNVADMTLDHLVSERLGEGSKEKEKQIQATRELMAEHQQVSAKVNEVRDLMAKQGDTKELQDQLGPLIRRKKLLSENIDNARDRESAMHRMQDVERKRAQQGVLDQAHVICATLSGSGHEMFQNLNIEFETVVVDEAAQCVEASALIPLKYGCAKCILVGDPKQLPPTVFSKVASRFLYEQSLFVRMQKNRPQDVHLLDVQYRMHPEISYFPRNSFYDGRLEDGPNMAEIRKKPWHLIPNLGPYQFFDVLGQHKVGRGRSLVNTAEIEGAMLLYNRLTTDLPEYDFSGKIGIITPYKGQLTELKRQFSMKYGQGILKSVEFNTTDAFQGRESEIIIFSCVRASPSGSIGFLQDIRRMNVGLTRAKSSLWVLGNSESLKRGEYWGQFIDDAKMRGKFSSGDALQALQRPTPAALLAEARKALAVTRVSATPSFQSAGPAPATGTSTVASTARFGNVDANGDVNMDALPKSGTLKHSESAGPVQRPSSSLPAKRKSAAPMAAHVESANDVEMTDAPEVGIKRQKADTPNSGLASGQKADSAAPKRPPPPPGLPFGARPPPPVMRKKRRPEANPLIAPNRQKKP